jgi:hypothetical protein
LRDVSIQEAPEFGLSLPLVETLRRRQRRFRVVDAVPKDRNIRAHTDTVK